MTDLELDAIEVRANAATSGPWELDDSGITCIVMGGGGCIDARRSDAKFIAHARSDLPALVAEVRRLAIGIEEALLRIEALEKHCLADVTMSPYTEPTAIETASLAVAEMRARRAS